MTLPTDDYAWLEQPDAARTLAWLREQAERTSLHLDALPGRDQLAERMHTLVTGPTRSRVKHAGDRRFRVSRTATTSGWTVQVADGPDGAWRDLVSGTDLGERAEISRWDPSVDGAYLAVQATLGGSERATPLSVVDTATGRVVDRCDGTRYSPIAWRDGDAAYFYVRRHRDGPGRGVYLHRAGSDLADDELVIGDSEQVTRYHFTLWHDRWLVLGARRGTSRAVRLSFLDLTEDSGPSELPLRGCSAAKIVARADGRLLALTTDDAELGKLVAVDYLGAGRWSEPEVVIDEDPSAVLEAVTLIGSAPDERLVVLRSLDGYSDLAVHDQDTGRLRPVPVPGEGTISTVNRDTDPHRLTIAYTDWSTAHSMWLADLRDGTITPADPDAIAGRPVITAVRTSYSSFDGVDVPLTILTAATDQDREHPQPRPTVLTCYGGFGITFRPSFQPDGLAWVLSGGTMAIAAVRGGGERGRQWHRAGAGRNKPAALRDLESAADWLVTRGWTTPAQLALMGGSNGGMVAAGTAVRRPSAYAALVASGAPLDMVGYERWGLGPAWRGEYGSADDPHDLATLLSYSPYHNVDPARGPFPATLLVAGDEDTRVDPVHSRKMTALLQDTVRAGTVLLRTVRGGGHVGGGSDAIAVEILSFLAHHLGLAVADTQTQPRRAAATPI